MNTDEQPAEDTADEAGGEDFVPHVALSTGRSTRPPPKVFAAKTLASRSLIGPAKAPEPRHHRPHGPTVKWTRASSKAAPARPAPANTQNPAPTPERPPATTPAKKGENMSERFISERLLSDRGPSFNPQIPRRVPDIPSPGGVKASEADLEGKRLIVGRQVKLSGEIGGCEKLVVEGTAEATLHEIKALEVGTTGTFKGTAVVETATIAGTFEGTLKVSGHLDIGPGATVKGTVSYGTITVASGGKLLGTVESAS